MMAAIESGFPQKEIAQASYEYQRSVEQNEAITVGVNKFTEEEQQPIDLLQIQAAEEKQIQRLRELRQRRSSSDVEKSLRELRRVAEGTENTMSYILDAVRSYATVGEICGALKDVFGAYTETNVL